MNQETPIDYRNELTHIATRICLKNQKAVFFQDRF